MKLYKLFKEIILEEVKNFKVWISGRGNIVKAITDLLEGDPTNYIGYYVDIKYKKGNAITNRWGVITHIGKSLRGNDIIRIYERNNDAGTPIKSKTYLIDKITGLKISKVKLFQIPNDWEDFNPNGDDKFTRVNKIAKFGTYKYALSTIKQRERELAKKKAEMEAKGETEVEKQTRQKEIQRQNILKQQQAQKAQQNVQQPIAEPQSDEEELNNNEINK